MPFLAAVQVNQHVEHGVHWSCYLGHMWCNHMHYSGVAGPWQFCMHPKCRKTQVQLPRHSCEHHFCGQITVCLRSHFVCDLFRNNQAISICAHHWVTSFSVSSSCVGSQHGGLVCVMVREALNLWGLVLGVVRGKELSVVSLVFFSWSSIFLGCFPFLVWFCGSFSDLLVVFPTERQWPWPRSTERICSQSFHVVLTLSKHLSWYIHVLMGPGKAYIYPLG